MSWSNVLSCSLLKLPFFICFDSVCSSYFLVSADNENPFQINPLEPHASVDLAPGEDFTSTRSIGIWVDSTAGLEV
jgi:hypothetical protein